MNLTINTAYVDGSFNSMTKHYGYGIVILDQYGKEGRFNYAEADPRYIAHRNVAGELFGAMKAIQLARNIFRMTEVTLVYDYDGIGKWPKREWAPRNELTKYYLDFVNEYLHDGMLIHFHQVKAHSGNKYNEIADQLAKEAVGLL